MRCQGMVAVPGIGTFVARRVAAELSAGHTLVPPALTVGFESYGGSLTDGELSRSLARALECDTTAAEHIMADDIEAIRREIAIDGASEIGLSGKLHSDGSRLVFDNNAEPAWLKSIELEPLAAYAAQERLVKEADERREAFVRSLRRTASSAAAIAGFAILAFLFSYLPGLQRGGSGKMASISYDQALTPASIVEESTPADAPEQELMLIFNTPADAWCEVVDEPVNVSAVDESDRYFLVTASFASRGDAEKHIAAMTEPASIVEMEGRYRICTLSGASIGDVQKKALESDAYDRHPNAWICRR